METRISARLGYRWRWGAFLLSLLGAFYIPGRSNTVLKKEDSGTAGSHSTHKKVQRVSDPPEVLTATPTGGANGEVLISLDLLTRTLASRIIHPETLISIADLSWLELGESRAAQFNERISQARAGILAWQKNNATWSDSEVVFPPAQDRLAKAAADAADELGLDPATANFLETLYFKDKGAIHGASGTKIRLLAPPSPGGPPTLVMERFSRADDGDVALRTVQIPVIRETWLKASDAFREALNQQIDGNALFEEGRLRPPSGN